MSRIIAITLAFAGLCAAAPAAQALEPIEPFGSQARLTVVGADGNANTDGNNPEIAYNSQANEFLMVWEQTTGTPAFSTEIFGRRLDAAGVPIGDAFQISGLTDAPNFDAFDPAVAYDHERNRYGVVFVRDAAVDGDLEGFIQPVSAGGAVIKFDGSPGADARKTSNIRGAEGTPGFANGTDVVYRPDANGDSAPGDQFIVVLAGDETADFESDIFLTPANAETGLSGIAVTADRDVSNMTATGDAFNPSIVVIPGTEAVAVTWEGYTTCCDQQIWVSRLNGDLPDDTAPLTQKAITTAATTGGSAAQPSLVANPDTNELLVAYFGFHPTEKGENFVQRLSTALDEIGGDQQISSAGPPGGAGSFTVSAPAAAYNPVLDRYLITWTGQDNGRSAFADDERERTGTVLDATGAESDPQDFVISRMGAQNDDAPSPGTGAVAVNTSTKRWLHIWQSDDAQPPLADNENEIWGRLVGENFDRDGDGFEISGGPKGAPFDCNDSNAAIKPGAAEILDNGVDEDCSGADAENLDRDGDGATRPGDCNDGNPFIKPGATDVAGNGVDEDCSGADTAAPAPPPAVLSVTTARFARFWAATSRYTKAVTFKARNLRKGMTIEVRCKGKGCPKALKKVKRLSVKKNGDLNLIKYIRRAKLRPKAVVEVRMIETGRIGRVIRFTMRRKKVPSEQERCLPPGATTPQKCT